MYQIVIEKRAEKFIRKQDRTVQIRLLTAINRLPAGDIKALKGHCNLYRLRVGEYRVLYTVDNGKLVICIIDVGNRGEIYNQY